MEILKTEVKIHDRVTCNICSDKRISEQTVIEIIIRISLIVESISWILMDWKNKIADLHKESATSSKSSYLHLTKYS